MLRTAGIPQGQAGTCPRLRNQVVGSQEHPRNQTFTHSAAKPSLCQDSYENICFPLREISQEPR